MSSMTITARAGAACAVWACALIALFGTVPASAAHPVRASEDRGQRLPVTTTVPADNAVTVRPDTTVSFQLDTQSPEYNGFRQQLESGRFVIQVEGGTGAQLYVGEQRSKQADPWPEPAGKALFDAQTGTLSTPPLSLRRYTTYTVTLAVKAAYEALLHGQPLPGNDSVTFAFITGSALHEPTRYQLLVDGVTPRVTEAAQLALVATDDYGLPAWGSTVSVQLTEDGARRPSSAVATPAQAILPEPGGVATFAISDTEAEGVQVSLQATGLYPENAWSGSASLRFRPGLPASFFDIQLPYSVTSETSFNVCARVADVHGNRVEDGTPVTLETGSSTVTAATLGGRFCASLLAPYGKGALSVSLRSGSAQATAWTYLLPPPPAYLTVSVYPPWGTVPADGSSVATLGAFVRDAKHRPVLNGTLVSWATTLGTLSAPVTTTQDGMAWVTLRSGTPGSAQVLVRAGSLSQIASVGFTPLEVAYVSNVSYSQPCWSDARSMNYGYGHYFRAKQGCDVLVSGTARARNGAPVPNVSITVGLRVEGSWRSATVTTNSSGHFTAPVFVSNGPGRMVSGVYENGSFSFHHWDWAYVYIISNGRLVDSSLQFYTLAFTRPY